MTLTEGSFSRVSTIKKEAVSRYFEFIYEFRNGEADLNPKGFSARHRGSQSMTMMVFVLIVLSAVNPRAKSFIFKNLRHVLSTAMRLMLSQLVRSMSF